MRTALLGFLVAFSGVSAQTIREFVLDPHVAIDLPVSREVTTITLPGAITAIAGADMLIDDGGAATEVEEGTRLRFHVTHAKGANFLLVQSLQPDATATLTVIFENAAHVLQLRTVATQPVASAIFKRPVVGAPVKLSRPPEPVRFTPRIGLSLLDRARAYPVLVKSLPAAVEGVTLRAQGRKVELPDLEIEVQEVYRFPKEDAVVFLLNLRNRTDQVLELAPSTFAARVANERFAQSIANGPRTLQPGEAAEAEFAIIGMPDGTRNDLSADNAFTILIHTVRREPADTAAAAAAASAPPSS
ncbi:hypothetical protein [Opitutus terrae]|uniref:Uncharacterized protein n=1 Tax=Opitutus terrae (strain DSM 11246 / JCM 15787 / PB90-1) TaxID=452637 RepID=B1ZPH3_OPITP|nr:hypothetical protein [Opitutus terrae]ACB74492.1 hypothetical protein Oter_1206 [Opitutus terrae PB90-1]